MKRDKKDKGNKQKQYSAIYFPEEMIDSREKTWFALQRIDCNFSRVIQAILHQLRRLACLILSKDKNFRHFNWYLIIEDKQDGKIYSTFTPKKGIKTQKIGYYEEEVKKEIKS